MLKQPSEFFFEWNLISYDFASKNDFFKTEIEVFLNNLGKISKEELQLS